MPGHMRLWLWNTDIQILGTPIRYLRWTWALSLPPRVAAAVVVPRYLWAMIVISQKYYARKTRLLCRRFRRVFQWIYPTILTNCVSLLPSHEAKDYSLNVLLDV